MNCSECHRVLPESLEGQRNAELEAHLTSCVACSELVEDLNVIARQAAALREADEPSPRVWNMIEAELRREGVIHPPPDTNVTVTRFPRDRRRVQSV